MNQQQVTVTRAASLAGVSRNTIYRKIDNGKLSRQANGLIQVSELLRVYPNLKQVDTIQNAPQSSAVIQPNNDTVTVLHAHIEQLEQSLKDAKEREQQAINRENRLMTLLENRAGVEPEKDKGLFGRLFK